MSLWAYPDRYSTAAADRYQPAKADEENLRLMKEIDKRYLMYPFYSSRKMTQVLKDQCYEINRRHIQRLYQLMDAQVIGPKPNTNKPMQGHKIYPYLLRNRTIDKLNQVWATDLTARMPLTYPMPTGSL